MRELSNTEVVSISAGNFGPIHFVTMTLGHDLGWLAVHKYYSNRFGDDNHFKKTSFQVGTLGAKAVFMTLGYYLGEAIESYNSR